jgi:hypothetical protein
MLMEADKQRPRPVLLALVPLKKKKKTEERSMTGLATLGRSSKSFVLQPLCAPPSLRQVYNKHAALFHGLCYRTTTSD